MNIQFDSPAVYWTEALPVGNGRLGAMVFGGVEKERIALNEETLWSGCPKEWDNPAAKEFLPFVRKRIEQEKYEEADRLCKEMMGPYTQSYLPFGDLHFVMDHGHVKRHYSRKLDLSTGIVTVSYTVGGVQYTREIFASYPDQSIVVRLTSSKPGFLRFRAWLDSSIHYASSHDANQYIISGTAPEQVWPNYFYTENPIMYGDPKTTQALRFHGRLAVTHEGGTVKADADGLHVMNATSANAGRSKIFRYDGVCQLGFDLAGVGASSVLSSGTSGQKKMAAIPS